MQKKERIWELDALRGICILCVIFIHFMFDLVYFLGLDVHFPPVYVFVQQYGGVIFVILSGICVTLGSHSVKRGAIVFGCGMLITLVTFGINKLGMAAEDIIVKFGVLHLLGICMLSYPIFKKLSPGAQAVLGSGIVILGYVFTTIYVQSHWLFPFGLIYHSFTSSDYFPLFPQLGWFLIGAAIGRTVYADRKTKLPGTAQNFFLIRFFRWCGRQSLWIYLLHQPVVYGLIELVVFLKR